MTAFKWLLLITVHLSGKVPFGELFHLNEAFINASNHILISYRT